MEEPVPEEWNSIIARHYDAVTSLYQAVAQDVRDGVVPEWLAVAEFECLSGYLSEGIDQFMRRRHGK